VAVRGWFYDPGRSRRVEATLDTDFAGVARIATSERVIAVDLRTARVNGRLAGVARQVAFPLVGTFETQDDDALEALLAQQAGRRRSRLYAFERLNARNMILALAIVVLGGGAIYWGLPVMAGATTAIVPRHIDRQVGDAAFEAFDEQFGLASALPEARRGEVEALFARLIAHSNAPGTPYRLEFRGGGRLGPNALAFPGGLIVVTDELMGLAPSDDGLAGVLAHEIAHVEMRHGMHQLMRGVSLAAIVTIVTGDVTGILNQVVAAGGALVLMSYSREHEREADARAVRLMRQAGFQPAQLAAMLERLESCALCETLPWISSHPVTRERIEAIGRKP